MLGDAPRTLQYWVRRFEEEGFAGLADADRPERPKKLSEEQLSVIGKALRGSPRDFGISANNWDGKTLSAFIKQRFGVAHGVRQCQSFFRQLGFRLRKPRPVIAKADPVQQLEHKKTPSNDGRSDNRFMGTRRSPFPAARFALSNVDRPGGLRSRRPARADPQKCWIFWCRQPARRQVRSPAGRGQVQCRFLLVFSQAVEKSQFPFRQKSLCDS